MNLGTLDQQDSIGLTFQHTNSGTCYWGPYNVYPSSAAPMSIVNPDILSGGARYLRGYSILKMNFLGDVSFIILSLTTIIAAEPYCFKISEDVNKCVQHVRCVESITENVKAPDGCGEKLRLKMTLVAFNDAYRHNGTVYPYLDNVITLDASSNNWAQIRKFVLPHLTSVKTLKLSDNNITSLEIGVFHKYHLLLNLDLSKNMIADIHHLTFNIKPKNSIRSLHLAHNVLKRIHAETFKFMKNLIYLDLSHNILEEVSYFTFQGVDNLEIIRLNNNKITHLNGALAHLKNLRRVFLHDNLFIAFEAKEIPNFMELHTFDISKNNLSSIHPEVLTRFSPTKNDSSAPTEVVQTVNMSFNKLTILKNASFPEPLKRLRRNNDVIQDDSFSTEIDLSKNEIETIEFNAFQGVARLIFLDLSSNRLTYFLINTLNMDHLKRLDLSQNKLKDMVVEPFYYMRNLVTLDLSNNEIVHMPKIELQGLNELSLINLSGNKIKEILKFGDSCQNHPVILDLSRNVLERIIIYKGSCTGMRSLILKRNNLRSMSSVNLNWQNELKFLDISMNKIASIEGTKKLHLHSLKHFDLSHNDIKTLGYSAFKNLSSLNTLILAHNHIERIEPGAFEGLIHLANLDLSYNKITYLESNYLFELKSLTGLNVEHNNMKGIDFKAWYGNRALLKIFVGGNSFKCDELVTLLHDSSLGWSGVKLLAQRSVASMPSIEGIACELHKTDKAQYIASNYNNDDRLLITARKILEAINKTNTFLLKGLRNFNWVTTGPLAKLTKKSD